MDPWIVVPMLGVLAALYVMLPVGLAVYTKFHRLTLVRCPATGAEAEIRVDATQAGLRASVGGHGPRVTQCSFWPRRKDCDEGCLYVAPSLVREVLSISHR
jgi:hypothetical protein